MRTLFHTCIGIGALFLVLTALAPQQAAAQQPQRCFPETGYCISGTIRAYWERNGGCSVFGYPNTAPADRGGRGNMERLGAVVRARPAGRPRQRRQGRAGRAAERILS